MKSSIRLQRRQYNLWWLQRSVHRSWKFEKDMRGIVMMVWSLFAISTLKKKSDKIFFFETTLFFLSSFQTYQIEARGCWTMTTLVSNTNNHLWKVGSDKGSVLRTTMNEPFSVWLTRWQLLQMIRWSSAEEWDRASLEPVPIKVCA